MKPIRVQLSRAKGARMPPNTLKVDRATRWGNPYNRSQYGTTFPPGGPLPVRVIHFRGPPSLNRCLDLYVAHIRALLQAAPEFLEPLRGKNLACWCRLDQPCHADVLLILANL